MSEKPHQHGKVDDSGKTPGAAEGGDLGNAGSVEDPGKTPGQAEGDRETAEASLRQAERKGQA
jgi:hypothetical protein